MRHGALKHRYLHLAQRAPRSNAMSGPKPLLHVQLVHYRLQTSRSLFIRANSRQHRIHGCIVRIWDAAVSPLRCLSTPVEGAFLNTPHLGGNYTKVTRLFARHSSLISNCRLRAPGLTATRWYSHRPSGHACLARSCTSLLARTAQPSYSCTHTTCSGLASPLRST